MPEVCSVGWVDFGNCLVKWDFMKREKEKTMESRVVGRLLSMKEACARWGVSRWWVYDRIKEGKMRPIVNAGKGYRWTGEEIQGVEFERL